MTNYTDWLKNLSGRYRQSQIKAAMAVNKELLRFYFSLGADILRLERSQVWGSKFLQRVSYDLRESNPDAGCFSETNLKYMRYFVELYGRDLIRPQLEDKLSPQAGDELGVTLLEEFEQRYPRVSGLIFSVPWGHHKHLIDKFRNDQETALFYVQEIVVNGWSRALLQNFVDSGLHLRKGKALTNFAMKLPDTDSDLAQQMTKDPYTFDFLALTEKCHERELKDALLANVQKFLLELGNGFSLVGREYRFQIGEKEKFADLVFYHYRLNRFVVVEVKTEEFDSSHLGQLGLYVSAANHLLKRATDAPTIGLLICKSKDNVMAKWALESASEPMGISDYQLTNLLPTDVKSDLPTIAEIEEVLSEKGFSS